MNLFLSIGAGPGIGLSTASHFARNGFKVILAGRTKSRLDMMVKDLQSQGLDAENEVLDASNPIEVQTLINKIISQFGAIDVLHYNAASLRQETLDKQPIETIISDLGVNIGGALAAIKTVVPTMSKQSKGTILLTGGGFAINPLPDFLSLSIGKAGIRALALGLFESLKEKNIHLTNLNVLAHVNNNLDIANDIATTFWNIYLSEKDNWAAEINYPQ